MTGLPTALEILELLSTRARYREWLASGHLESDHGMIVDNLTRVTAQVEALTHGQLVGVLEQLRAQANAAVKESLTTGEDSLPVELEAHWKAGFLRGAKWWYGRTEAGTMWQSEQNECWQAAGQLWPSVRPERLEDARQVALAQAEPAASWTAAELEDLRLLAWALGPENDGQLTITNARALTDTLSIARMVDPDPRRGRLLPELEALMSVSVREWLLIHRALNALLGQTPQALPEPEVPVAAPTAGEEPETLLESILDTLPNCRDFKLAAPDRDGEWAASFTYDHCDFEGQGSSPEAALVEASVERTIADHYYYADGARLTEAQMTDLLNTAYLTHLGHLPGHGYRGSYLKEESDMGGAE